MDAAQPKERAFYPHIEGLRGVAAFYVFIFHIWQTASENAAGTLTQWFGATQILQYGHFAVAAFIVISGYVLALPVAMRPERRFDPIAFFKRRARRLMPAYFLVLFLSVVPYVLTAVVSGLHVSPPHIAVGLALHAVLIHNLFAASNEYLNGPLWSIALEVQIYIVFALLLIPIWRRLGRFGLATQLGVALVLGLLPHFVLHKLDWTSPWLLGLFAMGVVAAQLTASRDLPRVPWGWLSLAAAIVAIVAMIPYRDQITPDGDIWPMDIAVGVAIALFFVAASRNERLLPVRFLTLRPVLFVGTFSYSLYLVHEPLVRLTGAILARVHAGTLISVVAYAALVVIVLGVAYAVYRVAERPFFSAFAREAVDLTNAPAVPARALLRDAV